MRTISAADANRHFSKLLRDVKAGETVVVTSRGEPVARIEPMPSCDKALAERQAAWKAHLARLRAQPALNLGPIVRDELYDE